MSGLIDDSICKVCLQPKEGSTSGRITQWVSICRCATAASEEELFSSLKICSKCYKRINLSRHGSFTQWIFRTDFCNCYQPQLSIEETEVESQEVRSFNDIDYPELEMDEEDTDFPYQRFKPVEILGQGAIGRVYRCQDRLLQKVVAVKVMQALQPQQVVSFQKEARLTAQLNHPHIIQIIDINITDRGTPYIVLEYVPGVSLRDYLTQGGPLNWKSALQMTEQILEALVYAHDKGIYHRDLKPENILLTRDEQNEFLVKLIDFGIALDAASEDADKDVEFQGKTFTGTPPYMSPDQAGGFSFDQKSEIYSVGCILFELLTGTKPFTGDTALEILTQQTKEEPPALDNNPEIAFLSPLLNRALSKSREARFESSSAFLKELKAVAETESASEPEAVVVQRDAPQPKLVPISVALISLAGLTMSYFWFQKNDEKRDIAQKQQQAKKAARKAFSSIILDSKLGGLKQGGTEGEFAANQFFDDSDMKALQNRKDIKVLFLKNTMISGASLKYLTGSPISHLILTGLDLKDADLVPLGQKMSIASLGLGRTGISGESLGLFKNMQQLELSDCPIDAIGYQSLKKMDLLKVLTVSGKNMNSPAFNQLSGQNSILIMNIHRPLPHQKGWDVIFSLKNLSKIGLAGGVILPEHIKALSKYKLDILKIDKDCTISDETIEALASLNRLNILYLPDAILNSSLVAKTRSKLPDLKIKAVSYPVAAEYLEMTLRAAERGNDSAQHYLGNFYLAGQFVDKDSDKAIYWLKKSASQGNRRAAWSLATVYWYGLGDIKKDRREGLEWCRKAAELNLPEAQLLLASCYLNGELVEKDSKEALKWIQKAAAQNNPQALVSLGDFYKRDAAFLPRDTDKARECYEKARALGYEKPAAK